MSIHIAYQALPEESTILQEFWSSGRFAHLLRATTSVLKMQVFSRPLDDEDKDFISELSQLPILYPGIGERNCKLNWEWHSIAYLISADQRKYNAEPDPGGDVGSRAVFGAEELLSPRSKQLRWSSSLQVREIANYLKAINADALARHFNPQRMDDFGVYRFSAEQAESKWHAICEAFDRLRAFYLAAAEYGEGALVVID